MIVLILNKKATVLIDFHNPMTKMILFDDIQREVKLINNLIINDDK